MRRRYPYIASFVIFLFFVGFYLSKQSGIPASDDTIKRTQIALGTIVDIHVRDVDENTADRAMSAAFAEIRRIDNLFTTFQEQSPVWKMNHSTDSVLYVPTEIYDLLVYCDSIYSLTDGAFDITAQAYTEAWGFDSDAPDIPSLESLRTAAKKVGWKRISLHGNGQFSRENDVMINFGAIAKGYAVDRAIETLKQRGISHALINAGGEIRQLGGPWKVGIQHPRDSRTLAATLSLTGKAVATSGDYERYFEKEGKRYHHIFDPRTGYPSMGCQSVTVISCDDMTADALATGIFVMGPKRGIELIERLHDIEALIIDSTGTRIESSGFSQYLQR